MNARSVLSDVQIDEHTKLNARILGSVLQFLDVVRVIDNDHGFGRLFHNSSEPRDFWLAHHFASDE